MKTLQNIIDELGLVYDEGSGVLEGDSVREIPLVNVLNNLVTLLKRLAGELDEVDNNDARLLARLQQAKRKAEDTPAPLKKRKLLPETPELLTTDKVLALLQEAARELQLFDEPPPAVPDRSYNCRKYGVAVYPTNDLQDYLPGLIPDVDFSKNKPPNNQVQFTTFQAYIELYFRPFSLSDLDFLAEKYVIPPGVDADYDPEVTPYLIPKLGEPYGDVWDDEGVRLLELYHARGTTDQLVDDYLYTEDVGCGPLSLRLLLAVLSEDPEESVATQLDLVDDYKVMADVLDFLTLEERLGRELKYIGIFTNLPLPDDTALLKQGQLVKKPPLTNLVDHPEEWLLNREDDEVCAEMRELQRELRDAVARNRDHRAKLVLVVEEQLAYQEYLTILEDLDKQVDQAYIKRLKQKNKKKKPDEPMLQQLHQQKAAALGLHALLDKRQRWIANIGKLFPPPEVMKRVPKTLVFDRALVEEAEDEITTTADLINNPS